MSAPLELRCFCRKEPLLGMVLKDPVSGRTYVHVKVFKQGRVFGEVIAESGRIRLRCRECNRWHRIDMKTKDVDFFAQPLPDDIPLEASR